MHFLQTQPQDMIHAPNSLNTHLIPLLLQSSQLLRLPVLLVQMLVPVMLHHMSEVDVVPGRDVIRSTAVEMAPIPQLANPTSIPSPVFTTKGEREHTLGI